MLLGATAFQPDQLTGAFAFAAFYNEQDTGTLTRGKSALRSYNTACRPVCRYQVPLRAEASQRAARTRPFRSVFACLDWAEDPEAGVWFRGTFTYQAAHQPAAHRRLISVFAASAGMPRLV